MLAGGILLDLVRGEGTFIITGALLCLTSAGFAASGPLRRAIAGPATA
jgi:hypothetical protein